MSNIVKALTDLLNARLAPHGAVSEFCRRTGFSRGAVDNWLNGATAPGLEHLERIEAGLGFSEGTLLREIADLVPITRRVSENPLPYLERIENERFNALPTLSKADALLLQSATEKAIEKAFKKANANTSHPLAKLVEDFDTEELGMLEEAIKAIRAGRSSSAAKKPKNQRD